MNYAVHVKAAGTTIVARWDGDESPVMVPLKLKKGEKRPEELARFLNTLTPEDRVYMALGGAGSPFADRAFELTNGQVWRVAPHLIKDKREEMGYEDKERDCLVIAELARTQPELFYQMLPVDERIVELQDLVARRQTVQQDSRIPAQLRLYQIERWAWLRKGPEESLGEYLEREVRKHPLFKLAMQIEGELDKQIIALVKELEVYHHVFKPIDGMGPITAARLIAGYENIHRFRTPYNMVSYSGWGMKDGQIQRRRRGERANYDHDVQDAWSKWQIFLMKCGDDAPWKDMFLRRKALERQEHPDVVLAEYACRSCRKRYSIAVAEEKSLRCPKCHRRLRPVKKYTKGHIHRMALRWIVQRAIVKGVPGVHRGVWREWRALEGLPTTW